MKEEGWYLPSLLHQFDLSFHLHTSSGMACIQLQVLQQVFPPLLFIVLSVLSPSQNSCVSTLTKHVNSGKMMPCTVTEWLQCVSFPTVIASWIWARILEFASLLWKIFHKIQAGAPWIKEDYQSLCHGLFWIAVTPQCCMVSFNALLPFTHILVNFTKVIISISKWSCAIFCLLSCSFESGGSISAK